MKFSKRMEEIEEKFSKPAEGNYVFKVLNVEDTKSKKGDKMLCLFCDIETGMHKGSFEKFPLRYYVMYETDEQLARMKTILKSFQKSNPNYITEKEIKTDKFDENKLKGLLIGGSLIYEKFTNKEGVEKISAKIKWLFSTDRVNSNELKKDTTFEQFEKTIVVDEDGLPF